jgi:branched-chain amino acid transport system permease protein
MANMWNLLAGYSGLISLCQPAFIGLAGYSLVITTWNGLPFFWGIIAGGIVSGLFALLISIPVFRLSGIYFAIGTLVVPETLRIFFLLWRPVGGALHGAGAGYRLKGIEDVSMTEVYWMALVVGIVSIFVMRFILKSRLGIGLAAIRDSSNTAASSGINVFKLKLFSFVLGAVITGLTGSIYFIYQKYIEPTSAFNIRWTMIVMLSAVIGGLGIETGPIIGTIIVVFLHFFLAQYAGWSLLLQGIMLIIIMLLAPKGIMGFILKKNK